MDFRYSASWRDRAFLWLMTALTFFLYVPGMVSAQKPGKLEIIQDSRIPVLLDKHLLLNVRHEGVTEGYRVQIFFDSGNESKKRAMDARTEFMRLYPEIPAYVSFQEPFFKVRVGDFRFKVEAEGLKQRILSDYPNAYTVFDRINFPRL